ncbi:lipoate--protein ligase [Facilibium subflavum]|uniref:lipoate--protein ligase n=1 Tax=Facilibium subflavum TaxID=2219058 RepID=UPI000E64D990|nr:lipoate--protein ligase [Facilibium subflavum]
MNVYVATSTDPFYNLAVENWLFKEMLTDKPILYLWQNTPCVVIGRAQNPWRECNLNALYRDQIPVIRRQSGGGTVYHDLGNLNYTVIAPTDMYDKKQNLQMIVEVLASVGVDAYISPRNDIFTTFKGQSYKISGSAFRETKDRSFHHGTLLINADTSKLAEYLHHKLDEDIKSKGVVSYRSQVMNLQHIYPNIDTCEIKQAFLARFHQHITYLPCDLNNTLILKEIENLKTWQWRFGKTLPFEKTFHVDTFTLTAQIKQGHMVELQANDHFSYLKKWVDQYQPIYNKQSFSSTLSHLNDLEKKAMTVFAQQIPIVLKEKGDD